MAKAQETTQRQVIALLEVELDAAQRGAKLTSGQPEESATGQGKSQSLGKAMLAQFNQRRNRGKEAV